MPQAAALQAQQDYQRQAAAVVYPLAHAGTPSRAVPPSVTPPPPADPATPLDVHRNNRLARMEDRVLVTRTADEETEDGRIRNKEAMAKIRDAWVYKQIRERVDEFTEYKQVSEMMLTGSCYEWSDWNPFLALRLPTRLFRVFPSLLLVTLVCRNMECKCQRQG